LGKEKMVEELTNGRFDDFIKEGLVLIDFYADWCMPCVMMGPIVDEMSETFKGKVQFGKVNVEDNSELASKFQISSIPNFILFKDGKKVEQFVGGMSADDFEEKVKGFL
jgi:thioredoxin 1